MKLRPILFSAPMVLALLAGRKTQTRRTLKPQPHLVREFPEGWGAADVVVNMFTPLKCPHGMAGDRLWVRETHAVLDVDGKILVAYRASCEDGAFDYFAPDGAICRVEVEKWKPSIFMKREWSRITLDLNAVRVERLLDISEADAIAEGIELRDPRGLDGSVGGPCFGWPGNSDNYDTARAAYLAGWDWLNGKGSAAKNPWVWVESFSRVAEALR